MKHCFHCKKRLRINGKPPRDLDCPYCGNGLKACLNCRFFEVSALNQCSEPMAQRVCDKEKANFCEYFHFKESARLNIAARTDPLADIKRLFTEV